MYLWKKLLKDSKAATAIEYGLIAALIAVAAIAAMRGLGTSISDTFNEVSEEMSTDDGAAAAPDA